MSIGLLRISGSGDRFILVGPGDEDFYPI